MLIQIYFCFYCEAQLATVALETSVESKQFDVPTSRPTYLSPESCVQYPLEFKQ